MRKCEFPGCGQVLYTSTAREVLELLFRHIAREHVYIEGGHEEVLNRPEDRGEKEKDKISFTAHAENNENDVVSQEATSSIRGEGMKRQEELYTEFHEFQKRLIAWSDGNMKCTAEENGEMMKQCRDEDVREMNKNSEWKENYGQEGSEVIRRHCEVLGCGYLVGQ